MKKRLQNLITSITGICILLAGVLMIFLNMFEVKEFTWIQILPVMLLGWVFLVAKDTLIEGVFLNIFKLKK
jgi:predicted membrane channel-forming protein YqfA (hemolysin III family)